MRTRWRARHPAPHAAARTPAHTLRFMVLAPRHRTSLSPAHWGGRGGELRTGLRTSPRFPRAGAAWRTPHPWAPLLQRPALAHVAAGVQRVHEAVVHELRRLRRG